MTDGSPLAVEMGIESDREEYSPWAVAIPREPPKMHHRDSSSIYYTSISVVVKDGGLKLIQVSDDGHGKLVSGARSFLVNENAGYAHFDGNKKWAQREWSIQHVASLEKLYKILERCYVQH